MAKLTNLNVPFTFQFNVTSSGTPEKLMVKEIASTIAFNHNHGGEGSGAQDTITDSANGFLAAGFQPGDQLNVSGSASNDTTATVVYHILSVTAGIITLIGADSLTTEAAGATVKLTSPKTVPDGIAVVVKAKYANGGTIYLSDTSAKALNTSGGGFSLRNNESISLQVENIQNIWIDATVSGNGVEVMFEKNVQS